MFKIFIIMAALAAVVGIPTNHANAQALNNNGATLNITSGTNVYVMGDFTNGTGSTINNAGNLRVSGNTTNNAAMSSATGGILSLEGSTAQTLGGTSDYYATDVVVNNAAGVTLATKLRVDGGMTFTNGLITATNSSYPVAFTSNGSVSGMPTDASHVNGYVVKEGIGAITFPTGDALKYQPVGINLSANSTGMTARYYAADAGSAPFGTGGSSSTPLLYYNKSEYWDLSPTGAATGTVTIYFDGYNNPGITNTADLRVAHKSGGQWLNEGATNVTGTAFSGSVTGNSISTFSPFTLGSISNNSTLPVRLPVFTANAEAVRDRIDWTTATEEAGTSFSIERSGTGSIFAGIGNAAGKGSNSNYTFYDEQPLPGFNYYRLAITKAGGTQTYSNTVAVRRDGRGGSVIISPVPATTVLNITNSMAELNGQPASISDMQGRVVYQFTMQGRQRLEVSNWPGGIYTLRLADGTSVRLIKQ